MSIQQQSDFLEIKWDEEEEAGDCTLFLEIDREGLDEIPPPILIINIAGYQAYLSQEQARRLLDFINRM